MMAMQMEGGVMGYDDLNELMKVSTIEPTKVTSSKKSEHGSVQRRKPSVAVELYLSLAFACPTLPK